MREDSGCVAGELARAGGAWLVLGGPGSGKTTVATQLVQDALVSGVDPAAVVMLATSRERARDLRLAVEAQTGVATRTPVVRTFSSLAFAVLTDLLARASEPSEPKLVSGADADAILEEILAGHARGEVAGPTWPELEASATALAGFRAQLRNLFARADEFGLEPSQLAALGVRHHEPMWVAAAQVLAEYRDVLASSWLELSQVLVDPSALLDRAVTELEAARAAGAALAQFSLIVVDDYHDATAGHVRLLEQLAHGSALVLLADPDQAVQGFRGGLAHLVANATAPVGTGLGAFGARRRVLTGSWRLPGELAQLATRLSQRLPVVGTASHRNVAGLARGEQAPAGAVPAVNAPTEAAPAEAEPAVNAPTEAATAEAAPASRTQTGAAEAVRTVLFSDSASEAAHVGALVRRAHALEQVAYRDMCVIARSSASARTLTRRLRYAGVPVNFGGTELALAQEPVAAALLDALDVVAGRTELGTVLTSLATSFLGGTTTVALRRTRRQLWQDLDRENHTGTANLLVELVLDVEAAQQTALGRLAQVLHAGRVAHAQSGHLAGHVEQILWAMWDAAAVAPTWQADALAGNFTADHDLDIALALFAAARQFEQAKPGADLVSFTKHVRGRELAADALINKASPRAVTVTTPAGAAGGTWRHVYVCGVQDGVWPDLRVRDTLCGAERLAELALGRATAGSDPRAEVYADELRMFYVACTRASERLVISAVCSADEAPSAFLGLVNPHWLDDEVVTVAPPASVRDVVARARAGLEEAITTAGEVDAWADLLAALEDLSPHANPDTWLVRRGPSSGAALLAGTRALALSPSKAQLLLDCPLRYALNQVGLAVGTSLNASLGTLIHQLAEEFPTGGLPAMTARLEELWPSLEMPPGWFQLNQFRRAQEMLATYDKRAAQQPPLAVEARFALEVAGARLTGSIDRIEQRSPREVTVIDIKTGSAIASQQEAEVNAQLAIYQLAINAAAVEAVPAHLRSGGAELMLLRKGATRVQSPLPATQPWIEEAIAAGVATVREPALPAREGTWCERCDFRSACPAVKDGMQVNG